MWCTDPAGASCQAPAVAGCARCRMHGGRGSGAPAGNQNARKHGLYDRSMRERGARYRALKAEVRAMLATMEELSGS